MHLLVLDFILAILAGIALVCFVYHTLKFFSSEMKFDLLRDEFLTRPDTGHTDEAAKRELEQRELEQRELELESRIFQEGERSRSKILPLLILLTVLALAAGVTANLYEKSDHFIESKARTYIRIQNKAYEIRLEENALYWESFKNLQKNEDLQENSAAPAEE